MIKKLCAKLGWYRFSLDEMVLIRELVLKEKKVMDRWAGIYLWSKNRKKLIKKLWQNLHEIYPFVNIEP